MAAKGSTFLNDLLLLIFNNTALALIGDASGLQPSAAAGSLYLSLHTASPAAGNQTTSEATYGSYARVAVARTSGGFTVSAGHATLTADALFPNGTSGTVAQNITHVGVGTASSGAGKLLYYAPLTPNLYSGTGMQPKLPAGTGLDVSET